jgi:hypothetical protein
MKVKQVVGEHKKGFKAKKYASKPKSYIEPHKPKVPATVNEEMPGQMVGKIQQVKPDGTVDIQKPSGDTTTVQATALQPGDNNKLTMQVPKIQPGMQVDASKTIEEDPGVPYFVDVSSGKPMAKTGGRGLTAIVPSKLWTELTPEVELKATGDGRGNAGQGFRKVKLQFSGKTFFGLEGGDKTLGSKIIVSPSDYQFLSTVNDAVSRPTDKPGTIQTLPYKKGTQTGTLHNLEEDTALLNKMLTIAGIK